jgi:hypothetical protein
MQQPMLLSTLQASEAPLLLRLGFRPGSPPLFKVRIVKSVKLPDLVFTPLQGASSKVSKAANE